MQNFEVCIDDGSINMDSMCAAENSRSVKLHDWQYRALEYFKKREITLFECPTGTGKTQVGIEIIKLIRERHPNMKTLIVVPKNVILETGWYKELYNNGIGVADIGVYYGSAKEISKVTITNMQSLDKLPLELFGLLILDEVHDYGTERLLEILRYPFRYRVGLSATIDRMDGNHMRIIKMFNYNVFRYSPKEALRDNVLNPFYFYNVGVRMDGPSMDTYTRMTQEINVMIRSGGSYSRIMKSNNPLKFALLAKMNERTQLVNNYPKKFDVVKVICEKHKNDKIIVFNQFNEQTNKLYWHLLEVGIKAGVLHSDINKVLKEEVLIKFRKDEYNILLCSRMIDEGYNLPKADVAVIMANNSTRRQLIQRIGRVLRKKEKHSHIYEVFCKETIEEKYSIERQSFFMDLASSYRHFIYENEDKFRGEICQA